MSKDTVVKKYAFIVLVAVLSGCAQKAAIVTSGYEKGALLKLSLIKGQVLKYKQTSDVSITAEVKGIPQTMYSTSEIATSQSVEDTGETASVKITFDNASGTVRIGDQMENIKDMEELIGKSISMKLSRDGKVTETKGLKDIDFFKKQGERASSQFEQNFDFLPNKVVKQGETWEKKTEEATTNYSLQSFEQKNGIDCAKIEGKGTSNYTENIDMQGIKGNVTISGTSKETIFFGIKEGAVIESQTTASAQGEQDITLTTGEKMKIPIYMDVKTNTELVR